MLSIVKMDTSTNAEENRYSLSSLVNKVPGVGTDNERVWFNIGSWHGKLLLGLIIVLFVFLLYAAYIRKNCTANDVKHHLAKNPETCPTQPCTLQKLGYTGPLTVDGTQTLSAGEKVNRSYDNTCFDTFHLSYEADQCAGNENPANSST